MEPCHYNGRRGEGSSENTEGAVLDFKSYGGLRRPGFNRRGDRGLDATGGETAKQRTDKNEVRVPGGVSNKTR
jgi:hypothetical protein